MPALQWRSAFARAALALALAAALLALPVGGVHAQSAPVEEITVAGTQTVQPRQVVAWTGLEVGQPATQEAISAALRRLFRTGRFRDVFAYVSERPGGGVELIFNVSEYPRLNSIRYQGLDKLEREDLEEVVSLRVGDFLSPAEVRRAREAILQKYRSEGYFNATVSTDEAIFQAGGRQDLVFDVVEGKKVEVETIAFEGNTALSDGDLRDAMETREDGWLRGGTYKDPVFQEDLERIVAAYRQRGYLDAQVTGHEKTVRKDNGKLDITITVDEGEQYRVGEVRWSGNTVFDDTRIASAVALEEGEVFDESLYQRTLGDISNLYYDAGYIYFVASPRRDIDGQVVDVVLELREGDQARVRKVLVAGNTKTHEEVIRRELRIRPGDLFANSELRESQGDIFRLGFFNDVRVDFQQTDSPTDIDLVFEVEEKQTGVFTMGVGFSQQTQASGFFNVGETNLFGRGQSLQFSWQFGRRRNFLDVSFTEPWLLGTPTLVGVDVFNRFSNRVNDFYETRVKGGALRLGRPVPGTRYTRASVRYSYTQTTLSDFDPFYVDTLEDLERELGASGLEFQRLDKVDWPQSQSSVRMGLVRNSTDNPFFPTRGSRSSLRYQVSGGLLGGDLDYQEYSVEHDFYQGLPGKFALHVGVASSLLDAFGDGAGVPDYERYRLGGNRFLSLRGYRDLDVVPRGNPGFVGGRFYTTLTSELLYPVSRAIHLLGFVDQGDTWNSFGEADLTRLRTGAGFGIRLEVPMVGRIGLDYGYGFDKEEPGWEAHFNFGNVF